MILKSNESVLATHLLVTIGNRREHDAVDLLYQGVTTGNDFHGVPFMVFEVLLDLVGGGDLLDRLVTTGGKGHLLAGCRHQVPLFLFWMLAIEQ